MIDIGSLEIEQSESERGNKETFFPNIVNYEGSSREEISLAKIMPINVHDDID